VSSSVKLKPSLRLRKGCNISAPGLPTSGVAAKSAVSGVHLCDADLIARTARDPKPTLYGLPPNIICIMAESWDCSRRRKLHQGKRGPPIRTVRMAERF
jgi:hypothetical protein